MNIGLGKRGHKVGEGENGFFFDLLLYPDVFQSLQLRIGRLYNCKNEEDCGYKGG